MFATVYLVDAKVHTVIPQEFIYGLLPENLFNYGVNSNQDRLVFFSQELFEVLKNDVDNNGSTTVDFSLPITRNYPLPTGLQNTCFIARIKKFFGE